jgi:hypothetical protein
MTFARRIEHIAINLVIGRFARPLRSLIFALTLGVFFAAGGACFHPFS